MPDYELRARWIEALRSGKYMQTRGVLRRGANDTAAYCCLGVAAQEAGYSISYHGSCCTEDQHGNSCGDHTELLPDELLEALDLTPAMADKLAALNDARVWLRFPEIAFALDKDPNFSRSKQGTQQ